MSFSHWTFLKGLKARVNIATEGHGYLQKYKQLDEKQSDAVIDEFCEHFEECEAFFTKKAAVANGSVDGVVSGAGRPPSPKSSVPSSPMKTTAAPSTSNYDAEDKMAFEDGGAVVVYSDLNPFKSKVIMINGRPQRVDRYGNYLDIDDKDPDSDQDECPLNESDMEDSDAQSVSNDSEGSQGHDSDISVTEDELQKPKKSPKIEKLEKEIDKIKKTLRTPEEVHDSVLKKQLTSDKIAIFHSFIRVNTSTKIDPKAESFRTGLKKHGAELRGRTNWVALWEYYIKSGMHLKAFTAHQVLARAPAPAGAGAGAGAGDYAGDDADDDASVPAAPRSVPGSPKPSKASAALSPPRAPKKQNPSFSTPTNQSSAKSEPPPLARKPLKVSEVASPRKRKIEEVESDDLAGFLGSNSELCLFLLTNGIISPTGEIKKAMNFEQIANPVVGVRNFIALQKYGVQSESP